MPILWNNVDIDGLRAPTPPEVVLDEIARTGYEGTQFGTGFPEGQPLRETLATRGLRLAEVYASIPPNEAGPEAGALELVRERLNILVAAGGEVLVLALDVSTDRNEWAGQAAEDGAPRFTDAASHALATLLDGITAEANERGCRTAFHPHAGTFVETPEETVRLLESATPDMGLCLDVGHWLVGGGEPVEAIARFASRLTHVHLKDVDSVTLAGLRDRSIPDFIAAIRARLFTELGGGSLDLPAVVRALVANGYDGWLMVEQDSCWGPPSESAAIGRRVLAETLRRAGADGQG